MMGDETLVPPNTSHPWAPWNLKLSYTETPVLGSATAETSAVARSGQTPATLALLACQLGRGSKALQPLPAPLQTVSDHPRALARSLLGVRLVPPTAVTYCEAAGYRTPNPASPELAVIAMPGWLK